MLQAARESDLACASGIKRTSKHHPQKRTGVHGSHALQKVPGHDDEESRKPDPMHTIGGELSGLATMAIGGTAAMYSVARLPEVARWEIAVNNRWHDELGPYLDGEFYLAVMLRMHVHACGWH